MDGNQNDRYRVLDTIAQDFHEKKRKRLKGSAIVLVLLPVVLGLIRWVTDSDKVVFLFIWVLCMFVISIYLVSLEYLDEVFQSKFDPNAADGAEEGEDE